MIPKLLRRLVQLLAYVIALSAAHSSFALSFLDVRQLDGVGPGTFYGGMDGYKFFAVDTRVGDVVTLVGRVTGKTTGAQGWLVVGYATDGIVDVGDGMGNGGIGGVNGAFEEDFPTNLITYSFTSTRDGEWGILFHDYERSYSGIVPAYTLTIAVNGYAPVPDESSVLTLLATAGLCLAVLRRGLRA